MISLVGPLTITCQCGAQLEVPILGATRITHHDGRIEITPHLDHLFLAEHFASHEQGIDQR